MPTPHYGQPRYRVIADKLRERIEHGAIPPGTFLPAESALTAEFRTARGTVRQAIAALREAGLVSTEHGRGTYVNTSQREDCKTETRHRQVAADPELATLFAVEAGRALIEQERIVREGGAVQEVVRTYRLFSGRE